MSYTPTSWSTGDTITAAAMNKIENGIANAGGGGYDAVIRLTHTNDSGADTPANMTPSIVSGTYAQLADILANSNVPNILVEYFHPWGKSSTLSGAVVYHSLTVISIYSCGYFPMDNQIKAVGTLLWSTSDTIAWS